MESYGMNLLKTNNYDDHPDDISVIDNEYDYV